MFVESWDAQGFTGMMGTCMCAVRVGCLYGGGAVCFCSWLPEKHPAHASAATLAKQWHCCLAFRVRGQGGASHHLPTKAQVTQLA